MPSGLIQLVKYGSQDLFFTGNPQISFFKTVYRRYTNFAIDTVKQNFQNIDTSLLTDRERTLRTKIERYGDLVTNIQFVFDLPVVKSSGERRFRWIKNIGTNVINYVSILIEGQTIDKNYGEWLNIWHELTLPMEKLETFNEMIGNVPEMYQPELAHGNNGIYPESDIDSDVIPSIHNRRIYVPLIFWFNRNPGLALPLIALQYNQVEIEFELKGLKDLYTIIETDASKSNYGYRIKPETTTNAHGIQNFIDDGSIVTVSSNTRLLNKFDIDPFLLIDYIYLDEEERRRFAFNQHEYLIEQINQSTYLGLEGSHSLELDIHLPTKEFVWVTMRDDIDDRNDWNNYTNWTHETIPPYSRGYINEFGATPEITSANYSFYKSSHILDETILLLDGFERFLEQPGQYFNMVQPYKHHKRCPKEGIHVYSFAMDADKFPQPTGIMNASHFNKIQLNVKTQSVYTDDNYKYNIHVYAVEYNILRIVGGMAGKVFT
jgi:hypothetical protein